MPAVAHRLRHLLRRRRPAPVPQPRQLPLLLDEDVQPLRAPAELITVARRVAPERRP